MKFVGQAHIMNRLGIVLPELYGGSVGGANFLLVGPSGYGKTTMAISIAHYLVGKSFEFHLGNSLNSLQEISFDKWVVFIDEIHNLTTPEVLYPMMDMRNHVLIFATNENGNLPEPFRNRCREFIFDDYDDTELLIIARESAKFKAPDDSFMEIITAGNRNPREIKNIVDDFGSYFSQNPTINSQEVNFREILEQVFRIRDGMDTLCRRYLEVLDDVGGSASLFLLKSLLHVSEETLKSRVEPILARKGLITITQKGRTLIYDNHL